MRKKVWRFHGKNPLVEERKEQRHDSAPRQDASKLPLNLMYAKETIHSPRVLAIFRSIKCRFLLQFIHYRVHYLTRLYLLSTWLFCFYFCIFIYLYYWYFLIYMISFSLWLQFFDRLCGVFSLFLLQYLPFFFFFRWVEKTDLNSLRSWISPFCACSFLVH